MRSNEKRPLPERPALRAGIETPSVAVAPFGEFRCDLVFL